MISISSSSTRYNIHFNKDNNFNVDDINIVKRNNITETESSSVFFAFNHESKIFNNESVSSSMTLISSDEKLILHSNEKLEITLINSQAILIANFNSQAVIQQLVQNLNQMSLNQHASS